MKDTAPDREHDQAVIEARVLLEKQVARMALVIGAHDAATSYVAIGAEALAGVYGNEAAAKFLEGCAAELRDDAGPEGRA
jgi:hypothetical protein